MILLVRPSGFPTARERVTAWMKVQKRSIGRYSIGSVGNWTGNIERIQFLKNNVFMKSFRSVF